LFLSQSTYGGGDSWAVKITAITQNEEETTIKLKSLQNSFAPLNEMCDEAIIHVKLRGQKWLVNPIMAKLENWLFYRNMFLLNPIPVKTTIESIELLKKASLTGEKVDFGIFSGESEDKPCHFLVRGILAHYPKKAAPGATTDRSPLQVIATYHYL
jgi:hypothetical protein